MGAAFQEEGMPSGGIFLWRQRFSCIILVVCATREISEGGEAGQRDPTRQRNGREKSVRRADGELQECGQAVRKADKTPK